MLLKVLAKELHKPAIRKFERWKIYSSCKNNIWFADLVGIQLISKCSKEFRFSLSVIHICSNIHESFLER